MLLRGGFRLFVAHASPKRSAVKTVRSPIGAFTWPVRGAPQGGIITRRVLPPFFVATKTSPDGPQAWT